MPSIPALILAGGRARRMGGGDKPLRLLAGRALLRHVLDRLRPQADPVLLSANGDPARFAAFGLPVLPDPLPDHPGPLAGVLAGLEWAAGAQAPLLLTVPGDTPFLPSDLVARLLARQRQSGAQVTCAASGGRTHAVVALWSAALAGPLRAALGRGEGKAGAFAAAHGMAVVDWPAKPDPFVPDPFLNINSEDDLLAAAAAAR